MAIDFGASLDKILGAYTQVSQVRSQVDLAKYNAVAQNQQALLHSPEAMNAREAYNSGNAQNPYMMQSGNAGVSSIPPALIYGGLALAGVALLLMARR